MCAVTIKQNDLMLTQKLLTWLFDSEIHAYF